MTNLDVAFASFWQLARHWNQGDKAKLELSCEDGSLQMQLSAVLGHPDKLHFPQPSPPHHSPPPAFPLQKKKKSPSQLRRQERRQREALERAEKSVPTTTNTEEAENVTSNDVHIETIPEVEVRNSSEKIAINPAEESSNSFKCNQCAYTNTTEKGLGQHIRRKHKISQVDGNLDFSDEEIDSINYVSVTHKVSVNEKKNSDEVIKDLTYFELWDNVHGFDVKEDAGIFSVEVTCEKKYYEGDFTVSRAASSLTSLPWPPDYTVISSQAPSYLTL